MDESVRMKMKATVLKAGGMKGDRQSGTIQHDENECFDYYVYFFLSVDAPRSSHTHTTTGSSTWFPAALPLQMSRAPSKKALPDKSFTKQQFNVFFGPVPRRQCLQEHHCFLKVHFDKLI
jgi:hypothetical protein